jgi:outer membrane receptor protein involved in Fe transport
VLTIDGIDIESAIDGRSRQNAPPEYIEEIQVRTGGIEPVYGGALGGVISAVTKSGGDAFHGDAWFYYDGNSLSAAPTSG